MDIIEKIVNELVTYLKPFIQKLAEEQGIMITSIISGVGLVMAAYLAYFNSKAKLQKMRIEEHKLKLEEKRLELDFRKERAKFLKDVGDHRIKLLQEKVPMAKVFKNYLKKWTNKGNGTNYECTKNKYCFYCH